MFPFYNCIRINTVYFPIKCLYSACLFTIDVYSYSIRFVHVDAYRACRYPHKRYNAGDTTRCHVLRRGAALGAAQWPPAQIFFACDQQPTIKRRPHPRGGGGKTGGSLCVCIDIYDTSTHFCECLLSFYRCKGWPVRCSFWWRCRFLCRFPVKGAVRHNDEKSCKCLGNIRKPPNSLWIRWLKVVCTVHFWCRLFHLPSLWNF